MTAQFPSQQVTPCKREMEREKRQKRYAADLRGKLGELRNVWDAYRERPDAQLLRSTHGWLRLLTGLTALTGREDAANLALRATDKLAPYLDTPQSPAADASQKVDTLLEELARELGLPRSKQPPRLSEFATGEFCPMARTSDIYIYDSDSRAAKELAGQLEGFGYSLRIFPDMLALQDMVMEVLPAAVILDSPVREGRMHELICVIGETSLVESCVPVLVVSDRDDLLLRLLAVRCGASAFLTKPVNPAALVDKLDALIAGPGHEPYRILVVDDDQQAAERTAQALSNRGWQPLIVGNPLQALERMTEFRPDLILMDLYMPECSGMELAEVIRQKDEHIGLPIVFLSSCGDMATRMAAMIRGGDDILPKDMDPVMLVRALEGRLGRSRDMRRLMDRDSLTGLVNHTNIKLRLASELSRTQRQGATLALAMIDLDRFKNVNDTYGHLTGDLVLKSLAKTLKRRLRKADIVGRYGGEEFAVILVDVQGEREAMAIMDSIRKGFARIRHRGGDREFNVTFSCGLALSSGGHSAEELCQAADRAMYKAKELGRNRIFVAG
ncbi:diguanylate cyclase (GGDEF) domain-containing protein [Desulfocurvibacter africanus PCS]|uniref:diguanylate cyclase n=1 Tax=Desulfocurvibacter africanus PCS TaxID=1262666 RepID=M5PRI9_DESAF|nr:diguanylate cyclase [Desulfocurvibacter africanus]EMG36977.1 diguanylate cyclase (GGDEF) domain-containing protein [Desulfocurvibacter africanus PCS]